MRYSLIYGIERAIGCVNENDTEILQCGRGLSAGRVSLMNEDDFEGTLVLEKLSAIDRLDRFFEAIDSDNFKKAASLMKQAGIDSETIAIVLKKMADADGKH
jgi:hypothetical protein